MNKNQNVRRVLSLLFAMVMLVSMMVVGTVVASAAETTETAGNAVAKIVDGNGATKYYTTLKDAVSAATTGNNTVTMLKSSSGDFTITQKPGVNIVIDGQDFTYSGTISLTSLDVNRSNAPELEFKNVVFKTSAKYNILTSKYAYNVTFNACDFTGATSYAIYVPSASTAYDFQFENECVVNTTGSFLQVLGNVDNMQVNGMHIINCSNSFKVNKGAGATVNAVTFNKVTVDNAFIFLYLAGNADMKFTIKDSNINCSYPVARQDSAVNVTYNLVLQGKNTIQANPDPADLANGPVSTTENENIFTIYGTKDGCSHTWTVYPVQVNDNHYLTLADAIAAANAGDTVKLNANNAENVAVDKNLTLDINGCNYTGTVTLAKDATLTAPAGLNVDTNAGDNYDVDYVDGKYVVVEQAYVAEVNGVKYETLAAALENATEGSTIYLLDNVTGNYTITVNNLTIDGAMAGTTGKYASDRYTFTGTLNIGSVNVVTINHVNFVNSYIDGSTKNTSRKLTVEYCNFNGYKDAYAIKVSSGKTVDIKNVVADNCNNGLLYCNTSVDYVTLVDVKVTNAATVVNFTYFAGGLFERVTTENVAYALHIRNTSSNTIIVKDCELAADYPIYVQVKSTGTVNFKLEGDNIFTTSNAYSSQYANIYLADADATLVAPNGYKVGSGVTGMTAVDNGTKYFLVNNATINAQLVLDATINVKLNVNFDLLSQSKVYVNDVELVGGLFTDIAAKQMADVYTVTVVYNGYTVGEATFSVKSIAEKTIAETDTHDDLLVALLNYGAAAQDAFDYNEGNLADANVGEVADVTVENTSNGMNYYGASLNLNNAIVFNFKFYRVGGVESARVTYVDAEGNTVTETVAVTKDTNANGVALWVVTLETSVVNAAVDMTCELLDGNGNVLASANDNVLSYCARALAGIAAMGDAANDLAFGAKFYQALANYVCAANN